MTIENSFILFFIAKSICVYIKMPTNYISEDEELMQKGGFY